MESALELRSASPFVESADASLVERAQADAAAFGELYERYYPRVYRYVYHRVGHASDAEDVTGAVFMKALEALSSFKCRKDGFGPWIFRIARNAVIDHYRRKKVQSTLDGMESLADDADPVSDVLDGERRAELSDLVQCLSAEQREVVLMRYAADLSFSEIAAVMGKNEPAIRMLLHRGLRKLKVIMGDERI